MEICIQGRLRRGWTLEDAINKPLEKCRKFTVNGESYSVSEWAKKLKYLNQVLDISLKRNQCKK